MSDGGFSNPIIGGATTLIRKAIQSANYVANVSGWRISKDGDAEFNNAVVRGLLSLVGINDGRLEIDTDGTGQPRLTFTAPQIPGYPIFNSLRTIGRIIAESINGGSDAGSVANLGIYAPGPGRSPYIILESSSYDNVTVPDSKIYIGSFPASIASTILALEGNLDVQGNGFIDGTLEVDVDVNVFGSINVINSLTVLGVGTMVQPFLRLVQQLAQSLPNATNTSINFTTGSHEIATGNAGNWHNPGVSVNRVTPDIAGVYECKGVLSMAASGGGVYQQMVAGVFKNGTRLDGPDVYRPDTTTAATSVLAFGSASMNGTTDYFEFIGAQTNATASAQNTNAVATLRSVFEVKMISR